jgi:hypothetical protein
VAPAARVKSRLIVNLILLAALVALGLYVYLRPESETAPDSAITTLKREQVDRIRVERRGSPTIELDKRGGEWYLRAPFKTRADVFQVDRLLDVAAATSKQKLPRTDLARFELDPPRVVVTLNDQSFAFGAVNEVTNEQYMALGDAVYLVPPYLGYGIPTDASKLISHRLLGPGEAPSGFDFGRWKAIKDGQGKWSLSGALPRQDALSQDDLNRWADEWKIVSSLAAEPHRGARARERVSVRLGADKAIVFEILAREPEVRLLRTDENVLYKLGAEAGRRLLDPWAVAEKT